MRWVTFAWRLALSTLRVSVLGLLCRTAEARGDSTGAVLGLVAICPFLFPLLKPVEIPQVQFLDEVVFMPVACRQFWGPDVQKTVVFHSCSLGNVADVPARAVHRRVDVPVLMQRRLGSCWRYLRFTSSPELVDIPVTETVGFVEGLVAMRG